MKIDFNKEIPRLYDFIYITDCLFNKYQGYSRDLKKMSLVEDTRVTEAKKIIWENVDETTPGLALFFKHKNKSTSFMRHNMLDRYMSIATISNYIEYYTEGDSARLQTDILRYYDSANNDTGYYLELMEDSEKLYSFINALDIDTLQKWEMTVLMNNPAEILEPFGDFCRTIGERIDRVYTKNAALTASFEKRLQHKINLNPEYLINDELAFFTEKVSPYAKNHFVLSYSVLMEFFGIGIGGINSTLIILGIHYDRSLRMLSVPDDILEDDAFFKALADKTRIKIIQLLMQRPMYVGEIARQCKLKISTVSYHLEVMSLGGLVGRETAKNHVFYHISEVNIRSRLKKLLEIFS